MSEADLLDENTWTIEEQRDVILMLEKSVWQKLSLDERMAVLQTISNIECVLLGIPYILTVSTK